MAKENHRSSRGGFPQFPDGDVVISVTFSQVFQLHSAVLRTISHKLADLLDETYAVVPSKRTKDGKGSKGNVRFRLEVTDHFNDKGERKPELVRVLIDSTGRVIEPNRRPLWAVSEHGKAKDSVVNHFANILGSFYNFELQFNQESIATILCDILEMVDVAESMGAVHAIQRPVENILARQHQVLWRSMNTSPVAWIDLGYRVRSPFYFLEAMKFLTGKYYMLTKQQRARLNPNVRELAKRKVKELKAKGAELESRVIAVYPHTLCRNDRENHGRSSYGNDVMVWVALGFFRHWFGQTIARDNGNTSPDLGYGFYSKLEKGGDAYFDRETLNNFFQRFTMSKKGMMVVENHILEIKELTRSAVEKSRIMDNNTQLDTVKYPVDYFLCSDFTEDDLPWDKNDENFNPPRRPGILRGGSETSEMDYEEDFEEEDMVELPEGPVGKKARKG